VIRWSQNPSRREPEPLGSRVPKTRSLEETVNASLKDPLTLRVVVLVGAVLLCNGPGHAREPWSADLERGGTVEVDPRTNRPVLIENGRETQLWDGVHRLDDGSVIRIESGRIVPTTDMLGGGSPPSEAAEPEGPDQDGQPADALVDGTSPCERLVLKVCGAARACWREVACEAARQLREMEREEWLKGADPKVITESGKQCREAMDNTFFAPCD